MRFWHNLCLIIAKLRSVFNPFSWLQLSQCTSLPISFHEMRSTQELYSCRLFGLRTIFHVVFMMFIFAVLFFSLFAVSMLMENNTPKPFPHAFAYKKKNANLSVILHKLCKRRKRVFLWLILFLFQLPMIFVDFNPADSHYGWRVQLLP